MAASLRCTASGPAVAARAFIQLSTAASARPTAGAAAVSPLLLDVLLPPSARAFSHLSARPSPPGATAPPAAARRAAATSHRALAPSRRLYATATEATPTASPSPAPASPNAPAAPGQGRTVAVFNPQKDEDGNDMILEITPRAADRLSQIMAKDENPDLALRVEVQSGGCHGFQYLMSLTTLPSTLPPAGSATAEASSEPPAYEEAAPEVAPSTTTSGAPSAPGLDLAEDTVFVFSKDGGQQADSADISGAPKIVLDAPSLELLRGSKVDFTMELIGSQFKITDNPAATSSCGCGTSFDIKF